MDFTLSQHADDELQKAGRSQIKLEWIQRDLNNPDYSDRDDRTKTIRLIQLLHNKIPPLDSTVRQLLSKTQLHLEYY